MTALPSKLSEVEERNRAHDYVFDPTCPACARKRECESEMFMFHAATGGDLDCTCGYHNYNVPQPPQPEYRDEDFA